MKTKSALIIIIVFLSLKGFSQHWRLGGNSALPAVDAVTGVNNIFGTNLNLPIRIFTNSIQKAAFTTNFSLGTTTIIPGVGTGDGLRITPRTSGCGIPSTPDASLDLWANDGKNRSYLTKSHRNTGMKFRSISLYCISNSSHETNFHNTPFVPL